MIEEFFSISPRLLAEDQKVMEICKERFAAIDAVKE